MVFPIRDDNTGRTRTPYVTYALIALNVFVFVFFQGLGANDRFTYAFSTIPQEIRTGKDVAGNVPVELGGERGTIPLQPTPVAVYLTLITAMFMQCPTFRRLLRAAASGQLGVRGNRTDQQIDRKIPR